MKLKRAIPVLGLVGAAAVLYSCSGNRLEDFEEKRPRYYPEQFLEGDTYAWGVVNDWKGKLTRRFSVSLRGRVEGDTLILDEDFKYDDGEVSQRHWEILKKSDGTYEGVSPDVEGSAKGKRQGNALRWQYVLHQKTESGTVDLAMDDWQFMMDERHVFNRVRMSKAGISVGEVFLFLSKSK